MKNNTYILIIMLALLSCLAACDKPEPKYKLKSEVGDVAYTHFEFSEEKTKFKKMKKNSEERKKQIRKNRALRDSGRGKYKKLSRWDY